MQTLGLTQHCNIDTVDRFQWLNKIAGWRATFNAGVHFDTCDIDIKKSISVKDLKPEHLTTLACFIETIFRNKCKVRISANSEVRSFLQDELCLELYWNEGNNYVPAKNTSVFNLWKVCADNMEFYARKVADYFKHTEFRNKDLTPISESLLEAYYNVNDHSLSDGVAYSFAKYDEVRRRIEVSVCDFGRGIAESVRTVCPDISDEDAILKAFETKFTIKSTQHNAGYGLENIRDACSDKDYLWVVSNGAAFVCNGEQQRVVKFTPEFKGTLLFYSISLDHLDDNEFTDDLVDL